MEINDENLACVGGIVNNVYENEDSEIISCATSTSFGVGNAHYRTGNKSGFVDTVLFGIYKSEIFEKIGYFDETLTRTQDDEFNYRLLKNGYKIFLSNKIKSKYYVRSSFSNLFKQYYQYGYWKVIVNKKHHSITTMRQVVPLLFILFILIGFISSLLNKIFAAIYIIGLFLYLLITVNISAKTNLTFKKKLKLIKTFFILHISYGLGYLIAIKDIVFFDTFAKEKNSEITR
jgi:GT2 family glycosyltransferase